MSGKISTRSVEKLNLQNLMVGTIMKMLQQLSASFWRGPMQVKGQTTEDK